MYSMKSPNPVAGHTTRLTFKVHPFGQTMLVAGEPHAVNRSMLNMGMKFWDQLEAGVLALLP